MQESMPPMGPSARLLLVDGHSLAYRAFHALPVESFAAPDGVNTNAVYGFLSMLQSVVESEEPTHIAVAFDVSRDTFRRAEFPDYKANRAATPPEFRPQVPLIRELLEALRIPNLAVEGYEADDIIATLGLAAAEQGAEVFILTGDRDSLQLVSPNITVLYPSKGVKDLVRLTPAAVEEKYGVRPDQYADFAAIRGDKSDNLPSIPGVGEKTAATWLQEYGSLAGVVEHADEIKGKVGEALRSHVAQVLLNRRLTALVHDVPLHLGVHDLDRRNADAGEITRVFDRLGFKQHRPKTLKVFRAANDSVVESQPAQPVRTEQAWKPGELAQTLATLPGEVSIAAALDGNSLVGLALAWSDGWLKLQTAEMQDADVAALRAWLSDSTGAIAIHGSKPLEHWAVEQGFSALAVRWDTELLEYLLNPGVRGLDLHTTVQRRLGRELPDGENDTLFADPMSGLPEAAIATADLLSALQGQLEPSVLKVHDDVELPVARLLSKMETTGIAVDRSALIALEQEFAGQMQVAEQTAFKAAGREFNLGSPKQLQELLFDERGLKKTKKIKTGYTTDAESLQWLFDNTGDQVVEQILRWREVSKLRQTVNGLLPLLDRNDRIHTTYMQTIAATGRLSSVDPNLQNIPVRTEAGRRIRSCFVAGKDYSGLLTADYSQIEMRIMAHLSEDPKLIAAFHSGEDLHTTVACQVFGVTPGEVTADMRRRIKAMSYGLVYGLGAFGLSQQLGIDPGEATALMERYFERFGGVQRYLREVVKTATANGYTETMFGRRRYLPDLTSSERVARAAAERAALNAPIQGSAADIIKLAMLEVDRNLKAAGLKSRLLLQVHDELVLEVAPGEQAEVERLVRDGMAAAANLRVPLEVSVGFGSNWDAAAH